MSQKVIINEKLERTSRVRCVYVTAAFIGHLIKNIEQRPHQLPVDAEPITVWYDEQRRAFSVVFQSPEFSEVLENALIPELTPVALSNGKITIER